MSKSGISFQADWNILLDQKIYLFLFGWPEIHISCFSSSQISISTFWNFTDQKVGCSYIFMYLSGELKTEVGKWRGNATVPLSRQREVSSLSLRTCRSSGRNSSDDRYRVYQKTRESVLHFQGKKINHNFKGKCWMETSPLWALSSPTCTSKVQDAFYLSSTTLCMTESPYSVSTHF